MKSFYPKIFRIVLLMALFSGGLLVAQELAAPQKRQIRPMIDLHGSILGFPRDNLVIFYYARAATGLMLGSHWGVGVHSYIEGRQLSFSYRRHAAAGITISYQQKRWLASADIGQVFLFKDLDESLSGYAEKEEGFSPSFRLSAGVRVAPLVVVGATACWDPSTSVRKNVEEDYTVLFVKTRVSHFYPNVFFGFTIPTLMETRKKGYKIIRETKSSKT